MNRALQWKLIDNFRRKLFLKYELKKIILNSLSKNNFLLKTQKYYVFYNKTKIIRFSNIIQQKNKCVKTGRVWSIVKKTKYSRFMFRNESYKGNLPGFRRASW